MTANRDSTASRAAQLLSDRLGDGQYCSPASYDARAALKNHCAFFTRYALTARTKQYGVDFALFSTSTCLKACQSHVAAYV